jgi:collagenase-like PrtC family protease
MIKNIEIPIIWNKEFHKSFNIEDDVNFKFYGSLKNTFPTGRPNDFESTNKNDAKKIFELINRNGHSSNYLLNGFISNKVINEFLELFDWIVNELCPDYVTISSIEIFKLLKTCGYKNVEISAIAGISNRASLEKLQFDLNHVKSLVLHHSFAKGFDISGHSFIDFLFKKDIEPIILVTESCFFRCPFRQQHYRFIGIQQLGKFIDPYQIFCMKRRLLHPESLVDLAGFLLPEQIPEFQKKTNIRSFKISGRSMSPEWILNTTKAYLKGQSPENLYEIIVFTSPFLEEFGMKIQDLFYLDSKAYNELYHELIEQSTQKQRHSFLKKKAAELFLGGKLKINDPNSQYDVVQGELKVIKKGDYLKRLETELDSYLISNNLQKLKATFDKSYEKVY